MRTTWITNTEIPRPTHKIPDLPNLLWARIVSYSSHFLCMWKVQRWTFVKASGVTELRAINLGHVQPTSILIQVTMKKSQLVTFYKNSKGVLLTLLPCYSIIKTCCVPKPEETKRQNTDPAINAGLLLTWWSFLTGSPRQAHVPLPFPEAGSRLFAQGKHTHHYAPIEKASVAKVAHDPLLYERLTFGQQKKRNQFKPMTFLWERPQLHKRASESGS